MSNYLQRLAARSSAAIPVVRPQLSPLYGALANSAKTASARSPGGENSEDSLADAAPGIGKDLEVREERSSVSPFIPRKTRTILSPNLDSQSQESGIRSKQQGVQSPEMRELPGPLAHDPIETLVEHTFAHSQEPGHISSHHTQDALHEHRGFESDASEPASDQPSDAFDTVSKAAVEPRGRVIRWLAQDDQHNVKPPIESAVRAASRPPTFNPPPDAISSPFHSPRADTPFLISTSRSSAPEGTVEVTIGHLEVRIAAAESKPQRSARPGPAKTSLDDYLRRRSRGSGS